jgi:hypothetical protein
MEFTQQISVPMGLDYDTNPTMVEDGKQSIWRFAAAPVYHVSTINDLNRWYADLGFKILRSSNTDVSINRLDPSIDVGWNRDFETSGFGVSLHFDKASSRFIELKRNGIVDKDGTATNKSISASWNKQLSDKLKVGVTGLYSKTKFSRSNFTDSDTKALNANFDYEYNEKILPFLQVGITKYNPDGKSTTSKNVLVGSKIIINPEWFITPAIGINQQAGAGSGFVGSMGFNWLGEKYLLDGAFSRSVSPSNVGSFQKTDRIRLSYSYLLNSFDRYGLDFDWSKNRSDFASDSKLLSGWFARDLSQSWQMKVYTDIKKINSDSQNVTGNIFGINFIYNTLEF